MPPRRRTQSKSRLDADAFLTASERARTLYLRIVRDGHAIKTAGAPPRPLSQPDRRDIAEYLFFELAAKFEQFCKRTLVIEVQKRLKVNRTRAEHMVGSSDEGISISMGGWGHVSKLKSRATGILGKNAVYAKLDTHLGNPKLGYLSIAVTFRNRIAHGEGNVKFNELLRKNPFRLTNNQCRGMSPGKLLVDYPRAATPDTKWFFLLLDAYETWVRIVKRKI